MAIPTREPEPPTPRKPTRTVGVMRAARALRAQTVPQAFGRCLALSLELCAAASRQGVAVDLIVWSVADDRHFVDHWAVVVDGATVIDLTRVQIDGRTKLTYDTGDYPSNFLRPRVYPAALFLPEYARHRSTGTGQLSPSFVRKARCAMLRHDLSLVLASRSFRRAGHSMLSLSKFWVIHSLDRLRSVLESRRSHLLERARLLEGPDDAQGRSSAPGTGHRRALMLVAPRGG